MRKWPLEESTWKLEFVGVSGQTSWVGGLDEKMIVNDNDRTIKNKQLIDQGYCTMIIQNKMIVVGGNLYLNFYEIDSLKLLRSEDISSIVYVLTQINERFMMYGQYDGTLIIYDFNNLIEISTVKLSGHSIFDIIITTH